jgi:hypothetical protein
MTDLSKQLARRPKPLLPSFPANTGIQGKRRIPAALDPLSSQGMMEKMDESWE